MLVIILTGPKMNIYPKIWHFTDYHELYKTDVDLLGIQLK